MRRKGSTLIELLLYVAILAAVALALVPMLFAPSEARLLQQTVAAVEQNGTQMLQTIGYHMRHAERVVTPASSETGAILTLQTGSGGSNPTIIGVISGSLILIQRTTKQTISSSQVAVEDFVVRNTSVSANRPSVLVRFTLSRTIRLQAPRSYSKQFEAVFTSFPDDVLRTQECSCVAPTCNGDTIYVWQVCEAGECQTAQTYLQCP